MWSQDRVRVAAHQGIKPPQGSRRNLVRMYRVDGADRVVPITDAPRLSPGAPLPIVMADEQRLILGYLADNPDPNWDGTYVRVVDYSSSEPVVIVEFQHPSAHMLGPPSDETLRGHPLWERGLRHYGIFRVEQSSWIRRLRHVDSFHREHDPSRYSTQTHYIFAFHDSTFECIAGSFTATAHPGPLAAAASDMRGRLLAPLGGT